LRSALEGAALGSLTDESARSRPHDAASTIGATSTIGARSDR
jgi:hypothetical protein